MARLLSALAFTSFASVQASRVHAHVPTGYAKGQGHRQVTCAIDGPRGESITFPVDKCHTQCILQTSWEGLKDTTNIQKQFSLQFSVTYKAGTCVCSVKGKGPIVQFRALHSNQAQQCKDNTVSAKQDCWEIYKKGRGTDIVLEPGANGAKVPIAYHKPGRYSNRRFKIKKTCQPCNGAECYGLTLPTLLEGLSDDVKAAVAVAVTAMKNGTKVDQPLQDYYDLLVEKDRDVLLFEQIDVDGDGELTADELGMFYKDLTKHQLDGVIAEVGDIDGKITLEHFQSLQDVVREKENDFEFERIDSDGDGALSLDELDAFYTDLTRGQMKWLLKMVKPVQPRNINHGEFVRLKEVMDEYTETGELVFPHDANLDDDSDSEDEDDVPRRPDGKIGGGSTYASVTRSDDDTDLDAGWVDDGSAQWHAVVTIKCMQRGVEVHESQCSGDKREAVRDALRI